MVTIKILSNIRGLIFKMLNEQSNVTFSKKGKDRENSKILTTLKDTFSENLKSSLMGKMTINVNQKLYNLGGNKE